MALKLLPTSTLEEVNRKVHLDPEMVKSISAMSRAPGPPNKNPLFRRAVETILPEQIYESIDGARVLILFSPYGILKNVRLVMARITKSAGCSKSAWDWKSWMRKS